MILCPGESHPTGARSGLLVSHIKGGADGSWKLAPLLFPTQYCRGQPACLIGHQGLVEFAVAEKRASCRWWLSHLTKDALGLKERYRRSEVSTEALLGRRAGTHQSMMVPRPWLREFQKDSAQ